MPLRDAVTINTGTRGRPCQRPQVLAADPGYDAKALRQRVRRHGIRPPLPTRGWKTRKPRGRLLTMDVPRFPAERPFAWLQNKYRRLVVRWERRSVCFNAFLAMAIIHMWIQKLIGG
jgi:Transposase DDE domain